MRRDPQDAGVRERWWLSLYQWWDLHEAVRLTGPWPDSIVPDAPGPVWLAQINRLPSRCAEGDTDLWVRVPLIERDVRVWVNGSEVQPEGPAQQFQIGPHAYCPGAECELRPPEGEVVLTLRLGR